MEADASSLWSLNVALGVALSDIILGADNAIVIALACRKLPQHLRQKAMVLGVAGAFFARLILTAMASMVMALPFLRLVGGLLLVQIAIRLCTEGESADDASPAANDSQRDNIFAAAQMIIVADLLMSLDNVLALTAVAQHNVLMLAIGLLLSVPILLIASTQVSKILGMFPQFVWIGGAFLGAAAGSLIAEDFVFGDLLTGNSSLANIYLPVLLGAYVIVQSHIVAQRKPAMQGLQRPPPLFRIVFGYSQPQHPHVNAAPGEGPESLPVRAAEVPATQSQQLLTPVPEIAPERGEKSARLDRAMRTGYRALMVFTTIFLIFLAWIASQLSHTALPKPDALQTYSCVDSDLKVNYSTTSTSINFLMPKGSVTAQVSNGTITWHNYQSASDALGVMPPNAIQFKKNTGLVLKGGAFDNKRCELAAISARR